MHDTPRNVCLYSQSKTVFILPTLKYSGFFWVLTILKLLFIKSLTDKNGIGEPMPSLSWTNTRSAVSSSWPRIKGYTIFLIPSFIGILSQQRRRRRTGSCDIHIMTIQHTSQALVLWQAARRANAGTIKIDTESFVRLIRFRPEPNCIF